jgi:hypothetical protein
VGSASKAEKAQYFPLTLPRKKPRLSRLRALGEHVPDEFQHFQEGAYRVLTGLRLRRRWRAGPEEPRRRPPPLQQPRQSVEEHRDRRSSQEGGNNKSQEPGCRSTHAAQRMRDRL